MGKFVVAKNAGDKYYFNLKADNGQVIMTSQGYTSKPSCMNGIESVRTNALNDGQFDRKTSSNDKPYFNLLATNGQIIGTSEMYESTAGRDNGIESVKKNAPDATVDDNS